VHATHGHPQEALPLYDQAGSLVNDSGDLLTQAMLLGGLAVSHSNMEDKDAAREFFKRSLDKVRALNDQIKVFICRGWSISEELADRTINRVAKKLPEIEGSITGIRRLTSGLPRNTLRLENN
jgi:hypothetical protein